MDKQNESNSSTLATRNEQNSALRLLNLLDEKQLASAEVFLKKFMSSTKGGIKSVEEGIAILTRAQDLNLPFSTCIEHIHVINGKTGIDVHIIKCLLSRAGVVWKCTKDYAPLYQYTDGNNIYNEDLLPPYAVKCKSAKEAEEKSNDEVVGVYPVKYYTDLKGNVYNEFQINDKCVIALNKVQALKLAQEGKYPIIRVNAQPIDYICEYEFTRYKLINGTERVITCTSHFSYNDAVLAKMFEKDTYQKYPRILISHRAFTLGARDIASDLLMGVMETSEIKLVSDYDLNTSDVLDAEVVE